MKANRSCSGAKLSGGYNHNLLLTREQHSFQRGKGGGFRSNDNLADLISRIRNGYFRSFEDILVIDSKQNRELLDALISAGYIYN